MSKQEGPEGSWEPGEAQDTGQATHQPTNGVIIGDVKGGIERTTIAGRDVVETTIDHLVYNVFDDETLLQEQRDRVDMLALMKRLWISHVLEPSLSGATRLTPVFEVQPDTVRSAWEMVIDSFLQLSVGLAT